MSGQSPRLAAAMERPNRRRLREDFPIFRAHPDLVYLDSGASAQKPQAVIDRVSRFYESGYANIHRGVYGLSAHATEDYEAARHSVARFLNAREDAEIVFVRGATEAINLVAQSWGPSQLEPGDRIVLSELEHHANIVPWQLLRDRMGIALDVVPIDEAGALDMAAFRSLLGPRTRLVAVTHVANATGAVNPIAEIVRLAHRAGALVLVDGAQAVPHRPVDVQALDADFYVFSGHKLYGPTGAGVLYGKAALLRAMPPWQGGGDMILSVTFEHTEFQDIPARFEAGTPDIAGVLGLATAIDYLSEIGWDAVQAHERDLMAHGMRLLEEIPGLQVAPAGAERASILSFTVEGIHPHDLGTILDRHHVAVRAGHHCAQPLLAKLGLHTTVRASLGLYNEAPDLDALAAAIRAAQRMFKR
jgi:cysteine desulfurase/selenocysteine lyase